MSMKKEYIPYIVSGLFLALSLIGIGTGVYFYRQYKASEEKLKNPTEAAKKEAQELVIKIGKLIILPNEEPQVATVGDVETLKKSQQFFLDAQNNDKILIFPNAKKAILYRPSTNIIVNVAPIIDQGNSSTSSGQIQGAQGQALKIALRNGSGATGVTQRLEDELKSKIQNMTITEKDNAKRMDYEKTLVISLSDTLNKTVVQQLANELSATTSALPPDEPKPAADLLIIAGKDRR